MPSPADDLFIPKINLVQMDRRASIASMIGMSCLPGGMFISVLAVTLYVQERNVHVTGTGLLMLFVAGSVASGAVAYLLMKLIGGKTTEMENLSAEFSERGIRLGDALTIRTEDIRKVRIRRYKHGCIDLVIFLSNKGQVRINPVVTGSFDLNTQSARHCQLCELIQTRLAARRTSSPA